MEKMFAKFICDLRIMLLHVNMLFMNLFWKLVYYNLIYFLIEGLLNTTSFFFLIYLKFVHDFIIFYFIKKKKVKKFIWKLFKFL